MSLTAHAGEWVQSQHSATRPLFSIHPFTINISQLFFLTSISLTNISATLESFGFPNTIPTCLANVSGLFLRGQPYIDTHTHAHFALQCSQVFPEKPRQSLTDLPPFLNCYFTGKVLSSVFCQSS